MPSRFFTASKKWPEAVRKALSFITDLPEQGDIDEPLFLFGPPVHGRLPFRIGLGGRTALSCELGGDYPFLQEFREWMERCLAFDRYGVFHPEIVTFEADNVYNQGDATGFIKLNALRLRVNSAAKKPEC